MNNKISIIFLVTLSTLAQASSPTIADAIKQVELPKKIKEAKTETLVEVQGIKPLLRPQHKDDKSAKKVLVNEFRIEGNLNINTKVLLPLLNEYKNKELSFNDMQIVASLLTMHYRQESFIVARAYIPRQNMSNGVLNIIVIEGVYGKFKIDNNTTFSTSFIQGIFDANKRGSVLHNDSLERSLLLANDIPGIVISNANIQAGKDVGSSDLVINVDETNAYDGYILANNYGGRYTGENQLILGLNLKNPFNIGDKLSLVGFVSHTADLLYGTVSYSAPLYTNGLRGKIGYSNTEYSLAKEFKDLDSRGTARSLYGDIRYPLIKKRAQSLDIYFNTQKSKLRDEVKSTNYVSDKNSYAYTLALDYRNTGLKLFNLNQSLKTSVLLRTGTLKFEDAAQEAIDKAGANTQGTFSKVKLSLDYDLALARNITLENSLQYQHTLKDKNLDGSEDFSIGGAYGIKLYPTGEMSAENGYLYNVEAKYSFNNIQAFSHKLGLFYDIGRVYMQKSIATFQARTLQDIGLGYYANYNSFFASLQIAYKIDNEDIISEPDATYNVLYMGGWSF